MIRFTLRRNRVQLPIWLLGIALAWIASANSIRQEFGDTDAERARLLKAVLLNPSIVALRGLPDGPELGQVVFFQVFGFVAVLAGLMSTFLATRGVRGDEERGRNELLLSTAVRRDAPLRATLVVGLGANVLVAAITAGVLAGLGLPVGGALLAGVATGSVGACFLGLGLLAGQLMPTSRAANTTGAVLVGVAYLLRAVGDSVGRGDLRTLTTEAAWPSWLSPLGWAEQTHPFRDATAWPLALILGLAVLAVVGAFALQARRDLGASIVPDRPGRATARPSLRGPATLVWRQTWPALVGWTLIGALFGVIAGALSGALTDAVGDTAGVGRILDSLSPGQSASIVDAFVGAIAGIGGLVAVAASLQTLLRARIEEADGRAELLLAGPASRAGRLLVPLVLALVAGAVVTTVAGLVAGAAFAAVGDDDRVGGAMLSGVAQLPALVAFAGVTALAFAVVPRASIAVGWGALGLGYVLGPVGGILNLPDGLRDLSPFQHTPAVPGPHPDWGPAMIVAAVGVALCVAAVLWMRRRELAT